MENADFKLMVDNTRKGYQFLCDPETFKIEYWRRWLVITKSYGKDMEISLSHWSDWSMYDESKDTWMDSSRMGCIENLTVSDVITNRDTYNGC